ncbi:hypothetical protein JXB31_01535 [Candidatus Woesearchaeota archaeon]|nr:hypothetical protein [Candidatus Woesearchaeota archaeon]
MDQRNQRHNNPDSYKNIMHKHHLSDKWMVWLMFSGVVIAVLGLFTMDHYCNRDALCRNVHLLLTGMLSGTLFMLASVIHFLKRFAHKLF